MRPRCRITSYNVCYTKLLRAFDRLKQEGKARFLGFSSHTPNLVEVAGTAIESGRFDVMMVAYHHGIWPVLPALIERARREQDT